jgi:hypothetical protein
MWIKFALKVIVEFHKAMYKEHLKLKSVAEIPTANFRDKYGFNYKRQQFKSKVEQTITKTTFTPMTREEALKVLDIEEPYTDDQLKERFELNFKVNDPIKGGSLFLRGKFIGAKEVLEQARPPE